MLTWLWRHLIPGGPARRRSRASFGASLALLLCGSGLGAQEASKPMVRTAEAGDVHLTVELDRSILLIDDRLRLTVRVDASRDVLVEFPDLTGQLDRLSIVRQQTGEPTTSSSDNRTWETTYLLQPEGVGELTLPALAITYRRDAEAPLERLATLPLSITVASVLPENADVMQPRGIGPPVLLPPSRLTPGIWILAGFLLVMAILGTIAWRRYRRAGPRPTRARAAHLVALRELERLRQADLAGRGRITELYVRLSEILRHYALWRFGLDGPTRTTEELLANMSERGNPVEGHRDVIAHLMTDCDLVKFARHRPSIEATERALADAQDFIERSGDPQILVDRPVTHSM